MAISRSIRLEMRNIAGKIWRENKKKSFCGQQNFRKSRCLWDYVEKFGTARETIADSIIRRMRFACWIINP